MPTTPTRPARGEACDLCGVAHALTFHHLIPRRLHHKAGFRAAFGIDEMRSRGCWLCRGCHDFIHEHFDERTLGRRLNTLEALQAEPIVERHVAWASKQRR